MRKLVVSTAVFLLVPTMASAQNAEPRYAGQGYIVFGLGTGTAAYVQPFMWQVGGGGEVFLSGGLAMGAEAGYVH